MCDPATAGMIVAGVASGASSALGKKGGSGGNVPTPSMPGLQLSPVTGVGAPSGTTPAATGGGGGGSRPASGGGGMLGTGLSTSDMGGLLGKLFQALKGGGGAMFNPVSSVSQLGLSTDPGLPDVAGVVT